MSHAAPVNAADVLRKKRDGLDLEPSELEHFLREFLQDRVTDYQMSAFLMAVCIRGMSPEETAVLTEQMVKSGRVMDFAHVPGATVDKHSTGGVGDWISLALAPVVAASGLTIPMMAGRGLGHTGGTLDKLESIPGYRVQLEPDVFAAIVERVGGVIAGQTEDLAPLDRSMYALRDVTGTVESVPLIVSSILSKKKAEGIDVLVMDVKCGRGAFMKTPRQAQELAFELCRVGERLGIRVVAFITGMDQPLGHAIGNAVEVRAALDCLEGRGSKDSREVLLTLCAALLCLGGKADSWEEGWSLSEAQLQSGSARAKFQEIVKAQGGDIASVTDPAWPALAPHRVEVFAAQGGVVRDVEPMSLALCALDMGAGRRRAEDAVDHGVGIRLLKKQGDPVSSGEPLAEVFLRNAGKAGEMAKRVGSAFEIGAPRDPQPLILTLVTSRGAVPWRGAATWSEVVP